jgi:DHA3 family tetracycline resistance protein-like MFS transporter
MHRFREKFSAYTVYLIFSGASYFFFSMVTTIDMVYQVEVAKLDPLQLVLVGTALEVVCFVCQVPTGILADVYSRRLAVILGTFIVGAGFILQGSIPTFVAIVIGDALFGVGSTLTDGAEQAWITDEVGVERVGHVFMRSTQMSLVGALVGALLSTAIASYRLNVPIVLGGVLYVALAIFLIFFMPERGFQRKSRQEEHAWREFGNTFKSGLQAIRIRPILITILFVGLFLGMYSEGFDRLSTAHFLLNFAFPAFWGLTIVIWFGFFKVAGTLLALAMAEVVRRFADLNRPRLVTSLLFVFNTLMVITLFIFAMTGNFYLAVAAYLAFTTVRSIDNPVYITWLTQNTEPGVRATVISLAGQVDALGQIAGGPPVGLIGTLVSLPAALATSSGILALSLPFLAFASRKRKAQATVSEDRPVLTEPV